MAIRTYMAKIHHSGSLIDPMSLVTLHRQLKAMTLLSNVFCNLQAQLYRYMCYTFNNVILLQARDTRMFWNPIIKKESALDNKHKRDAGVWQYSSTNNLFMQYVMNHEEKV